MKTNLLKQLRLFTAAVFLLIANHSFSQTQKGFVSGEEKSPLQEATILNLRTGSHSHSNEIGYFEIQARDGDTIQVTHVSYVSSKVVAGRNQLNIALKAAPLQLNDVSINNSVRHLNVISNIDLKTNPVSSSQELLRKVPGLFIGQHAGGGKAEQIFLRGFDIDHGTDINLSVDGMPVNMLSHAHGQGYADLHFLIPETVDKIDFDKGPYFANRGNLATAGYVAFKTKDRFDNNSITLEGGQFGTFRSLGQFNIMDNEKQNLWFASEYLMTQGYFVSPQNFNRVNLVGKYTTHLPNNGKLSLLLSHFKSKWDASGQIPQRAVDAGTLDWYGAIDDTEGGNTQRTNAVLQYLKQVNSSIFIKNTVFFSYYDIELYSNFTFFLNDPANSDQIKQKEARNMSGFESELTTDLYAGNTRMKIQAGAGVRHDDINNIELSHTVNRKTTLEQLKLGDIDETNLYGYANLEIRKGKFLINPAIRFDYLKFDYVDKLATAYQTQSANKAAISPKLNLLYNYNRNTQFFVKLGKGFHSNDTRVAVEQKGKEILPAAYGADAGMILKPTPRLVINTALWYLFLQQEFVYVGDEGVVEPGGKTERKGIDVGVRYQIGKSIFFQSDLTYTHARSTGNPKGENLIPLAPKLTFAGSVSMKNEIGFNGSISTRYLGNRPANEDGSIIAKGYCITDVNMNYQWRNFGLGVIANNIFNIKWKETQFATESRLQNETSPVTENHFTPGTPFNIRAVLSYKF
ncbi:MAG: TonB-dependent receptor plug domain-containing protein [Bacteroidota bacterium]